jgi:hypothetical protein
VWEPPFESALDWVSEAAPFGSVLGYVLELPLEKRLVWASETLLEMRSVRLSERLSGTQLA